MCPQRGIAVAGVNAYEDSDLYLAPPPPLPDSDADLAADMLAADGEPGANATGPPDAPAPPEPAPQVRELQTCTLRLTWAAQWGAPVGATVCRVPCQKPLTSAAGRQCERAAIRLKRRVGCPPRMLSMRAHGTQCRVDAAFLNSRTIPKRRQPRGPSGNGWRVQAERRKQQQPAGEHSTRQVLTMLEFRQSRRRTTPAVSTEMCMQWRDLLPAAPVTTRPSHFPAAVFGTDEAAAQG